MSRSRPAALLVTTGWVAAYLVVALTPLALALVNGGQGDGFLMNLSMALGFLALSVFGLQLVLGSGFSWATKRFGNDTVMRYHRQISVLALLATLGHPTLLFVKSAEFRQLLNVLHDPLRTQLGWLSAGALVVLVVTSLGRGPLRLPYAVWHALHASLGVVVVLAALGHVFLVDGYTARPVVRAVWILYGVTFLWLKLYVRVIRPVRLWRRPWEVVGLHPEPGDSLTVTLAPRFRHRTTAMHDFRAGQFAWLLTGHSPFSLTYHPFSLSSSAVNPRRVEFTIKRSGRFTSSLRGLHVGDRVYLDGPHGTFTLEQYPGPGYVFLAAGVGITPFLSMLVTLADQHDQRPLWLFVGNRHEARITGIRQLNVLHRRLKNLTVVHAISQPSPAWAGERGRITPRLLATRLPDDLRQFQFLICASPGTTTAYRDMLRGLGVPSSHIHSEQFSAV